MNPEHLNPETVPDVANNSQVLEVRGDRSELISGCTDPAMSQSSVNRLVELERRYRGDHERRVAELAPRIREVLGNHANEIGQWRAQLGICCAEEWQQFAEWVRELPNDEPHLRLLASFPIPDWTVVLDNYFTYIVGSDSFGVTADEWCYRAQSKPPPAAHERLFELLLLDAVAQALAYPW
jgi:hypothetical protein